MEYIEWLQYTMIYWDKPYFICTKVITDMVIIATTMVAVNTQNNTINKINNENK